MKKKTISAAVKSIIAIIVSLMLFATAVAFIGFYGFTDAILDQYSSGAFLTAETAVKYLNPDRMPEYWASGGVTEEYQATWRELDTLCNTSDSTFIYVIVPEPNYKKIRFLFSTINKDSPYSVYNFGYLRDTTNEDYETKYRRLYERESTRELVIRDRGYIETDKHITAMVPIVNSKDEVRGILCVQRQLDALEKPRVTFLARITMVLIGMMLLVILGQAFYLRKVLLRPLNLISNEAERFSKSGELPEKTLTSQIKNRDELGQLAESVDRMEIDIRRHIDELTRVTAEKERIGAELSLATKIQESMLPTTFPPYPERSEFDLYASMDPAKEVGGDFYDFFLVDEDHLCMLIADVSGKGVPAALFMMATKIILSNFASMGKSPAEILTATNETLTKSNTQEMFVTVWLGMLEISTGKLTAANAGHEYPVIKKPGGAFELLKDKHGFVIGGMSGLKYKEYEVQLEPGSQVFVYTDGVPEATNKNNELFGTERMLAAANETTTLEPGEVLEKVRAAVDRFVEDAEQFDDLTMLCLSYKGTGANKEE